MSLLQNINSPEDLKKLSDDRLLELADEIRRELIVNVASTGGHLGPNLGVVELTIALHKIFSTPKDKILFDVSHQGYVHKMLTGRASNIDSIRQYQGLNGFLLRDESPHDCYGAGHAGTAISAALGFVSGRDLRQSDERIIAVAGDAAFTCGTTFEALNNIKRKMKNFIIVLNDNEWSIDRNVGAIADYFNRIATSEAFSDLRAKAVNFVEKIAGKAGRRFVGKVEESAKSLIVPSVIFEEFSLRYFGPIDGHNLPLLIKTFDFLSKQELPVILHIITKKGKGYRPAIEQPMKFHGLGKYKVETGATAPNKQKTYSQVFAETLVNIAKKDEKITAITAAMPGGTGLSYFKKEIPERYFDVGIAEEHAALFASGQAAQGFKPFLTIYSTFMQRAFDMLIHDIALQKLPVRLCMDRAGLSGDDGPTHHGLFDIGYLGNIPGFALLQAKDEAEFADMLYTMSLYEDGPIAIRYPRGVGTGKKPRANLRKLAFAKAEKVHDGEDIAIVSLGSMWPLAKELRDKLLAADFSASLINARWARPFDEALILAEARKCRAICVLEDGASRNGFGANIICFLHDKGVNTPVVRVAWPDKFIEHGGVDILRKKHGISVEEAFTKLTKFLDKKSNKKAKVFA